MADKLKKLMLWDGNNLFRRVAGNKGLAKLTYRGKPTGAIHGTVKSIVTDIQLYRPDEVAIVFDGSGARTSKQVIYAGYKANRASSMDDSLHQQMITTIEVLKAAGLCVLQKAGVDADDALGALAKIPGRSILIQSNDKDFLQMVNDRCSTIRNRGNGPEVWDTRRVIEHYGLKPRQISDYLALCGDAIDGIPGLAGCGDVYATELLQTHGSLEAIIKNRNRLPPRWSKAVNKQREELLKFHRLTKLDTSVISPTAMQNIMPRLVPGKYSSALEGLCANNGLVWLGKWFSAHKPCVIGRAVSLWN